LGFNTDRGEVQRALMSLLTKLDVYIGNNNDISIPDARTMSMKLYDVTNLLKADFIIG
jgi:ATP-dependent 26S proteasome regulatory subunit